VTNIVTTALLLTPTTDQTDGMDPSATTGIPDRILFVSSGFCSEVWARAIRPVA
jgi:hypothetical protein